MSGYWAALFLGFGLGMLAMALFIAALLHVRADDER